jgi:hypothetical protein
MTASTPSRSARSSHGFVVLVVLVVLAILSAVVVSQFSVVTSNTVLAVRSADDAQARALAEGCLTMMQEYAEQFLGTPVPLGLDFDGLLNPDTADITKAFLPPVDTVATGDLANVAVLLPKGLSGTADFLQRHRWLLVPRDSGDRRGACLVRFDDNSDDGLPGTTLPAGVVDDADEGPGAPNNGRDNAFKDRDRAIYLTAIGLFPYLPATAAADAYAAAHGRVTLRRLFSTGAVTGQPAIVAGGDVAGMKGVLCSPGAGVVAATTGVFKSGKFFSKGGCGCGQMTAGTTPTAPASCLSFSPLPPGCDASSCAPVGVGASTFDTGALTARLAALRPGEDWTLAGTDFALANVSFAPAPDPGSAATPVNIGGDDLGAGERSCKLLFDAAGSVFVWDANEPGCENVTTDAKRPCAEWTGPGAGSLPPSPTPCTAPSETKCWRRIHSATPSSDWKPDRSADIPNVNGTRRWDAAVGTAGYLCGGAGSCTSCNGAVVAASFSSSSWSFAEPDDDRLPTPAYLIVASTGPTDVAGPGNGPADPLRATFVTAGPLVLGGDLSLCGVGCDCSGLSASFGASTGFLCAQDDADVARLAREECTALRGRETCTLGSPSNKSILVGDVRCGTTTLDGGDNVCLVGDVAAMSAASPPCRSSAGDECPTDVHLCLTKLEGIVGDVFSATSAYIEGGSSSSTTSIVTGTIAAAASYCSKDNVLLNGNIVVGGNVGFKGSPIILAAGGGVAASLRAMVETAW